MRVEATLNNLRIAPRKVRLVTHTIVGLPVSTALVALNRQVKRGAAPVTVLLKSAIANAKNNFKLDEANLFVKEVIVMEGIRLKRYMPKAFGQATPILRRTSKVRIVLDERAPKVAAPKKKAVSAKKAAPAKKKEVKKETTKQA